MVYNTTRLKNNIIIAQNFMLQKYISQRTCYVLWSKLHYMNISVTLHDQCCTIRVILHFLDISVSLRDQWYITCVIFPYTIIFVTLRD